MLLNLVLPVSLSLDPSLYLMYLSDLLNAFFFFFPLYCLNLYNRVLQRIGVFWRSAEFCYLSWLWFREVAKYLFERREK